MRKKTKVEIISAFRTPLFLCRNGPKHLNQDLLKVIRRLKRRNPSTGRSSRGGWQYHGHNLFDEPDPAIKECKEYMLAYAFTFLDYLWKKSLIKRKKPKKLKAVGWPNVSKAGNYNVDHCHPNSFFSSVYYLQVPKKMKGGGLIINDPRCPMVEMAGDGYHSYWGEGSYLIKPKAGTIVMFPSWLSHSVEAFQGPGQRISIAVNIAFYRRVPIEGS